MVGLWVLAGAFYAGDIGKTRDDYTWAVNDPATGRVALVDLWRLPLFWRPLSLITVRHLVSLTWSAPWIANLLTALSHLLLVVVFWRWLCSLGFGLGAAVAAMLLLTLPAGYDVMHWPAAMPTALAGMLLLAGGWLVRGRPTPARWAAMGGAAFAAACFNEQATACMAALALLPAAWSARIGQGLAEGVRWVVAIGSASVLYVLLVAATAPPGHRGGMGSLVGMDDWPPRAGSAVAGAWDQLFGPSGVDLVLGGVQVGVGVLGLGGFSVLAASLLLGLWWVWSARPEPACPGAMHGSRGCPAGRVRPGVLVLVGLAWLGLGLVPFVIVRTGPIEARHVYLPAMGLLLAMLGGLRWVRGVMPGVSAGLACRLAASVGVLVAGVCSVSLVGIQTTLRVRWQMDVAEAAAIARVFPSPPAEGVVLIARAAWREADTGRPRYDRRFWSAWQMDHIATAVLRHQYGRKDLYAKHRFAVAFGVDAETVGQAGWTTELSDGPAWDGGRLAARSIPWDRLVALTIEADGTVVPIDRLVFRREGRPVWSVDLPAVRAMSLPSARGFDVRLR
ncbi:MAG: hypothetical protein KatS3mg103_1369 [Phycisphaerales bacterium]|nr:MAG: hypothetical protein KatS3mg103_1369 [Phycisphaerales bacterium]